jgi:hypothetical protein
MAARNAASLHVETTPPVQPATGARSINAAMNFRPVAPARARPPRASRKTRRTNPFVVSRLQVMGDGNGWWLFAAAQRRNGWLPVPRAGVTETLSRSRWWRNVHR